ncbi:MAG: hypothetical protein GAK43_02301 [Stenotrophomonas maltophilia]|nr:MAG: hypothetical protein GAK43_02301 [Stenotrophomonas maltophilia]
MQRCLSRAVPVLSLFALLAGCAGQEPAPSAGLARVDLGQEAPNQLFTLALDGQPVHDLRYFDVPPGPHRLSVQLDRSGDDSPAQAQCQAMVEYAGFSAGQRYRLAERATGRGLVVRLYDDQGHALGDPLPLHCYPS